MAPDVCGVLIWAVFKGPRVHRAAGVRCLRADAKNTQKAGTGAKPLTLVVFPIPRSPSIALSPFFLGEGYPTNIDYRKNGYP